MSIEEDIFKKSDANFSKFSEYGFKKIDNKYVIEKTFCDNGFKAIITIDSKGKVTGQVIDLEFGEEYTNIRANMSNEFVNSVREAYKNILIDIRKHCFKTYYYIYSQANKINDYINEKYDIKPEFLWKKFPTYGAYRNKDNNKWFAIIMNLDSSKIGQNCGEIEIINVKLNRNKIQNLLETDGFTEAYHMNKKDWITIILNNTIEDEVVMSLVDESYGLIGGGGFA